MKLSIKNIERYARSFIYLDRIRHNVKVVRQLVGTRLICVAVKADGYGHGIIEAAYNVIEAGADMLGVASVGEGETLRAAGIQVPILIYSLQLADRIDRIVAAQLQPFVADIAHIDLFYEAALRHNSTVAVHLKIDTGMGRIGCTPEDAAPLASRIVQLGQKRSKTDRPMIELAGTATHLADTTDGSKVRHQLERFEDAIASIRKRGISPGIIHAANSGAILDHPQGWYDMVRPGIMIYGYHPDPTQHADVIPAMELEAPITSIKKIGTGVPISYGGIWTSTQPTTIATVNIGYGDGYPIALSNRAEVYILPSHRQHHHENDAIPHDHGNPHTPRIDYTPNHHIGAGCRAQLVGRVCMDQVMIDIGNLKNVKVGDWVRLFGARQHGLNPPDANELASICNTIAYEIILSVGKATHRIYVDSNAASNE